MAVDTSWMDRFITPSEGAFSKYLAGQQGQFNPMIRMLTRQARGMKAGKDPIVKAYQKILSGMRSSEDVKGKYATLSEDLAKYISGQDFGAGSRAAGSVVSALGEGLGVDPNVTSLVAGDAGAGAGSEDIFKTALLGSSKARLARGEAEALSGLEERRSAATLGQAEARKSVADQRREMSQMIAQLRGQRMASRANPIEIAQMLGGYQDWMRSRGGGGYGGYGGGNDENQDDNLTPEERERRRRMRKEQRQQEAASAWTENATASMFSSGSGY